MLLHLHAPHLWTQEVWLCSSTPPGLRPQEENLLELFDGSSASSDVVWRPDGLVGQKCVTPLLSPPGHVV